MNQIDIKEVAEKTPSNWKTELGKITSVEFGNDIDLGMGIFFVFEGKWGGVNWSERVSLSEAHDEALNFLLKLKEILKSAKVNFVHELEWKPVEVTFHNRLLKSWRILEEVL